MSMTKKAGTELVTGISPIEGMVAQRGSKSAGGELKVFRNEEGDVMTIYVDDAHNEVSFEGLLRTSDVAGKGIGDEFSACGVSGYITAWTEEWSNDDVAKVSGSLRDYTLATGQSSQGTNAQSSQEPSGD